mmetsp:Transcript_15279/g.22390  ORF Transcript_15279/g.22390 Transcript_15279/m.22390 type:complete len:97 (+) Transcript_15279:29-319(+)
MRQCACEFECLGVDGSPDFGYIQRVHVACLISNNVCTYQNVSVRAYAQTSVRMCVRAHFHWRMCVCVCAQCTYVYITWAMRCAILLALHSLTLLEQ